MTGNSDSPQIKLFNEFNRGFKEKNLDLIAEHLHKDFRRCTYPRSLNKPEQNREEWLKHFSGIIAFATEFDSNVHSIIEAPGKVILHATNEAKNTLGVNTVRESIYIAHFVDEAGTLKIKQIDEFTDSKVFLEIVQALSVAKEKLGK